MNRRWLLPLLWTAAAAFAAQDFPGPDRQDRPDPLASPDATVGGELSAFAGQYPKSLNYYLDNNVFSAEVFSSMYETLLTMHPLTSEYEPALAERWSISDDKKTFTFRIDPRARWSDGRPVTAQDVTWTFEAIMDPGNLTGAHKVALEKFDPPQMLDERTVRFTSREVHWRNLSAAGGFHVLPKHAFQPRDFNKINFEFPVVSGPYRIGELKEGVLLRMARRADWWQRATRRAANTGNFQAITYRFYAERENAFEAFKKGIIDVYPIYTARLWMNETGGERFSKNWIVKQKIRNYNPVGFQGFAMNMRRQPFDDLRVRKAMAHLLDRRRMNRTLMYNQYFMHRSYYEDLYSDTAPCQNPYLEFDMAKARELLKAAGWQADPDTGVLQKNGRRFTFSFLTRSPTSDKFLAIYGEALKDVGINMKIDRKDWAAWAKDMDEFNFDMTWAAWGAGLFKDPEGMWLSTEADRRSGNNITGFKDPRVDALIEKQKTIFDVEQRHAICRQIDRIVAEQCPYALLWNINYTRLLYWNKFGTPRTVLSKYGDERSAYWYWWVDEDSAADLEEAVNGKLHLPPGKPVVSFDEEFDQP